MKDSRVILGEKIGMTQVFDENRALIPVTVVRTFSCVVSQLKTLEKDGYAAVQLAYGERKVANISKPIQGHLASSGLRSCGGMMEFRVENSESYKLGEIIDGSIFSSGELIDVIGKVKGHGFQGVVKRYKFAGGPASHGSMFHRRGGSYGCREWPGKVYKGRKMPGRDGGGMRTMQNIEVVSVLLDQGFLLLRGSLPGAKGGLVVLRKAKKGARNEVKSI